MEVRRGYKRGEKRRKGTERRKECTGRTHRERETEAMRERGEGKHG